MAGLFWRRYEAAERRLIARTIDGLSPIIELGGSIGFNACILGRRFPATRRIVVEADVRLVELLQTNLKLNGVENTDVRHRAIDYSGSDHVNLVSADGCSLSGFVRGGVPAVVNSELEVPTTQLGLLVEGMADFALISDIEGGEVDLMIHEPEDVRSRCRQAVIEFHRTTREGREWTSATAAAAFATAWRMQVVAQEGDVWAFSR